ncbi:hypothetical protein [Vibrio cholerae]|uniref:hypothetical protein n=1 Tax=Vibrio cholerae TaxID=666 RepID=UPI0015CF064B
MNKSSLLITAALVFSTSSAFAGGTLGGNPSADSGAVNVSEKWPPIFGHDFKWSICFDSTQQYRDRL